VIVFYLANVAASALISFVLTRYVRHVATCYGWVAAPALDRHLHSKPLPRLGGVAIFLSFVLSFATALWFRRYSPQFDFVPSLRTATVILAPGCLVFLLGVYDDIRSVGPYAKFAVQAIAGAMLYAGGLRVVSVPVIFGSHHLSWFVDLPLTILWVLAVTNAFNLIDGVDGLAAGSALFSTLVVFFAAIYSGSSAVSWMALSLAGAILGFLRFNFSPATIFLGDCGSLFIGFVLSALALQGATKAPTIIAVAIPMVSFGLPILETGLSVVRRFLSGRPLFRADREHIHHKLLQRGLTQRQVVVTLYAVSALFALLSLFLLWPTGGMVGLVLTVLCMGVWAGVKRLGYLEFGELRRVAQRTIERQLLINNLAMRRATEELKAARDLAHTGRILMSVLGTNDFDAFDLRLYCLPAKIHAVRGMQLISGWGEAACLRWKRPGSRFSKDLTAWCLTLDLVSTRNRRCGSLTIYRIYTDRDLQCDINLLTTVFPVALADALDRAMSSAVEVMPAVEPIPELVTAHAG